MQQRAVAVAEATNQKNIEERGDVRLANAPGRLEAQRLGDRDQVIGVRGRVLRVATAGNEAHHPVAKPPALDFGTELFDRAGGLEPENL